MIGDISANRIFSLTPASSFQKDKRVFAEKAFPNKFQARKPSCAKFKVLAKDFIHLEPCKTLSSIMTCEIMHTASHLKIDASKDKAPCGEPVCPVRYLGIPIHYRKLWNVDWKGVEDRFERKLSTWKGKNMSYDQYPTLSNVARKKQSTVAEVMSTTPLNISFRRAIVDQKLIEWDDLILRLANITLSNENDCFVWSLHKNGQFSVKSMYTAIMNCNVRIKKRILWDLKIPLKIKVFMWFLHEKPLSLSLRRYYYPCRIVFLVCCGCLLCWVKLAEHEKRETRIAHRTERNRPKLAAPSRDVVRDKDRDTAWTSNRRAREAAAARDGKRGDRRALTSPHNPPGRDGLGESRARKRGAQNVSPRAVSAGRTRHPRNHPINREISIFFTTSLQPTPKLIYHIRRSYCNYHYTNNYSMSNAPVATGGQFVTHLGSRPCDRIRTHRWQILLPPLLHNVLIQFPSARTIKIEMDQVAMAIDRPIDRHLHHQLRTCAHGRDETTRSGTEESKAFAWPLTRSIKPSCNHALLQHTEHSSSRRPYTQTIYYKKHYDGFLRFRLTAKIR
uniref:p0648C09.22 protein n=1 Tax=Oryza sativa subsp. japonica TaxID=39947 RepID=Q8RYX8_ORYSJ|nr:P0648C09.22 [Oryza sativa Japonica Group]